MKKHLSLAVTALFATVAVSLAGPDKAAMEAKENAAWQAYKDKKADAFQKVVDKDIKCVYDTGLADLQGLSEALQSRADLAMRRAIAEVPDGMYASVLEADGFAVDVALNGTDGLWLAREEPYDASFSLSHAIGASLRWGVTARASESPA